MTKKSDRQNSKLNPLLNWVLSPFEDPIGLARPLWIDVSRYQGFVDMGILKSSGVQGVTARSSISWGYIDTTFEQNRRNAIQAGLLFNSYHVIYPGENALKQTDNWYRAHPSHDGVARTIDMELEHGIEWRRIADNMWKMSDIVKSRDGFRPIIYSRKQLIETWLGSWTTPMLNSHYYHLAQYLWDRVREHPGPPDLPNRVDEKNVLLHQTADKKAGDSGAVQSKSVDHNRWERGGAGELHAFIERVWGGKIGGEIPIPPEVIEFPLPLEVSPTTVISDEVVLNRKAINQMAETLEL